jgi:hypothetical protein
VTSYRIGRESPGEVMRSRSETAGGLTPASLCAVPTGLAEILALYPGLTPWANFMPPPERGLVLAVETSRLKLSFSVGIVR